MTAEESPYGYYSGPYSDEMLKAVQDVFKSALPAWQPPADDSPFMRSVMLAAKLRAARREFERGVNLWTAKGREESARKNACKK